MRDILLSGTAGFLSSCAAAFAVHRALWKGADEHARHLDSIAHTETERLLHTPKHDQGDSFEGFVVRRISQWWNRGVDNVHGRLLGLPNTVDNILEDVKPSSSTPDQ